MHHESVTTELMPDLGAAYPSSPVGFWLEDLRWHRRTFVESRFRWATEDAVDVVTWHTGGQTEFTTVDDLRSLQTYQYAVLDQAQWTSNAMADKLEVARRELDEGLWGSVLDGVGLTQVECDAALWFAEGAGPGERDSTNIRRVLKFVPFRNPLIEAFELKQLMRLYQAAGDMLEDAICDLLEELSSTRPDAVLADASSTPGVNGIRHRVEVARRDRGLPGDQRRIPEQIF